MKYITYVRIIDMLKLDAHMHSMNHVRDAYRIMVWRFEGKRWLRMLKFRWYDTIKMVRKGLLLCVLDTSARECAYGRVAGSCENGE
jgi:hypothetical protein